MLREAEAKDDSGTQARVVGSPQPSSNDDEMANAAPSTLNGAQIHARVKGEVTGWEPGTVFELDNGQQWKVLKGSMRLRQPLQSPEIVVVPGLAGRWFLQVDEDMPKARVYRLD
jgi:hypothetical protein